MQFYIKIKMKNNFFPLSFIKQTVFIDFHGFDLDQITCNWIFFTLEIPLTWADNDNYYHFMKRYFQTRWHFQYLCLYDLIKLCHVCEALYSSLCWGCLAPTDCVMTEESGGEQRRCNARQARQQHGRSGG